MYTAVTRDWRGSQKGPSFRAILLHAPAWAVATSTTSVYALDPRRCPPSTTYIPAQKRCYSCRRSYCVNGRATEGFESSSLSFPHHQSPDTAINTRLPSRSDCELQRCRTAAVTMSPPRPRRFSAQSSNTSAIWTTLAMVIANLFHISSWR